ncbi:hypothetical protein BDZ89DRAFT_1067645 [Hymenopellis radicata]|nr:hypothetical protein BDZ89DRAFT_1067645 [Hymenopellis radicata]
MQSPPNSQLINLSSPLPLASPHLCLASLETLSHQITSLIIPPGTSKAGICHLKELAFKNRLNPCTRTALCGGSGLVGSSTPSASFALGAVLRVVCLGLLSPSSNPFSLCTGHDITLCLFESGVHRHTSTGRPPLCGIVVSPTTHNASPLHRFHPDASHAQDKGRATCLIVS